jgi:hypothetical protein
LIITQTYPAVQAATREAEINQEGGKGKMGKWVKGVRPLLPFTHLTFPHFPSLFLNPV